MVLEMTTNGTCQANDETITHIILSVLNFFKKNTNDDMKRMGNEWL